MSGSATTTPADARAIAETMLFDRVSSHKDWSLPEDKALFSKETAIDAMIAFSALTAEIAEGATGAGSARVGELRDAAHGARIWFEMALAEGDTGTDFLNEGGWDGAPAVLQDLCAALATPVGVIADEETLTRTTQATQTGGVPTGVGCSVGKDEQIPSIGVRALNLARCLAQAEIRSDLDRCVDEAKAIMSDGPFQLAALAKPTPPASVSGGVPSREEVRSALVDAARARGGAGAQFIADGHSNLWLDIAYTAIIALFPASPSPSGEEVERALARIKQRFGGSRTSGVHAIFAHEALPDEFDLSAWADWQFKPTEAAFHWADGAGLLARAPLGDGWSFTELGSAVRATLSRTTETPDE